MARTPRQGLLAATPDLPEEPAAEQIDALGISIYDGQGRFLGLQNVAGQLQGALGGMADAQRDAALGTIFGNEQITDIARTEVRTAQGEPMSGASVTLGATMPSMPMAATCRDGSSPRIRVVRSRRRRRAGPTAWAFSSATEPGRARAGRLPRSSSIAG